MEPVLSTFFFFFFADNFLETTFWLPFNAHISFHMDDRAMPILLPVMIHQVW